ncbi:tail fiber domain-containing protein [Burkholderia multivorans]|uniref:tail fiber domain-containing protein n=1 Tax=Burkholderia multivorans TaxID=87883 RepID=UPI001C24F77D|nr:tail fiber domain-containing protein [Burkholderia multivorans]MBU9386643.1 tail fiber domain-containing protein [Burkholderia multivorans]MBU9437077.1 tail fiber domain-containing protein [Burkholderia multivorans]MBU9606282.1 tail fiber domain-containing protein [Burkholderia multivorans]MBU9624841.1 tail fiber domain-containing protein [Burkholderia multivorans]
MALKLANNAVSRLAAAVAANATSISLTPGDGAKFPTLGAGDWFPLTVVKGDGSLEVMRCTARAADTLTVSRAQEGTPALAFAAGDRVELRFTAAAAMSFLPLTGGSLTGALLFNGATQGTIPPILFQLNGKYQWGIGSNAAAWLAFSRYDANGTWINDPLQIDPSGKTWINGDAQVGGSLLLGNSRGIYFKRTDGNYHIAMQLTADNGNNTDIINADGAGRIRFINDAYNAELGWFNNGGDFWVRGNIQGFSDRRMKSNIKRIKGAMAKVRALVGVTFTRRRSKDKTRHMGFIAQDVEPIVPEVVRTDEKGMKSIAYANLTALLAEALKEVEAEVKNELKKLGKRIAKLEAKQ